jgi:DNA mismatch repair protein MutH
VNPAPEPPTTEAELLQRARTIAGLTVGELAKQADLPISDDTTRTKGLTGRLVEWALGADAKGAAAPDFTALEVELKTIPLDATGKPRESTFVCSIDLSEMGAQPWQGSRAQRKLARVLWVPVEAASDRLLRDRRLGTARLWSPTEDEEAALQRDWEELSDVIARGDIEQITAHLGACLQVRPKAADSRARGRGRDAEGAPVSTLPRGFYLRPSFTARLFEMP